MDNHSQTEPWREYAVSAPSEYDSPRNQRCIKLNRVSHITHVEAAVQLVKDGIIQSKIVSDKSKLKTKRVLVTWMSPKFWSDGSLYGSVGFVYDFHRIATRYPNYYWVEVLTTANQTICRILLTSKDYATDVELIAYDPRGSQGPWWYDEGADQHYFNNQVTLEFLIEDDIDPIDRSALEFQMHHTELCKYPDCPDKGESGNSAAGRFLAGLISEGVCISAASHNGKLDRTDPIYKAVNDLYLEFSVGDLPKGGISSTDAIAGAICRAMAHSIFKKRNREFDQLAALFRTEADAQDAVIALICRCLGVREIV